MVSGLDCATRVGMEDVCHTLPEKVYNMQLSEKINCVISGLRIKLA